MAQKADAVGETAWERCEVSLECCVITGSGNVRGLASSMIAFRQLLIEMLIWRVAFGLELTGSWAPARYRAGHKIHSVAV
jgi:hypothetical protein